MRAAPLPGRSFRISCGDRFIIRWRGHCGTERRIAGKTFQYALRRNNLALGNAVNQFVQCFAGHMTSLSVTASGAGRLNGGSQLAA